MRGKTALVTGGSRGIGRACAELLAAEGVQVFVADILDCSETVNAIIDATGQAQQLLCDVSDEQSVIRAFNQITKESERLDFMVHCAGIIHESALLDTRVEDFDRVTAINLRGTFLVGRETLRLMSSAGSGRVVLIASDMSYYGREAFSSYVASKHGVLGLMRSWAKEFAPDINVNAICPGPIDTDLLSAQYMSSEWLQKELELTLLKRFGKAEEVANMARYLCGDGGAYVTGQGIGVNGGSIQP